MALTLMTNAELIALGISGQDSGFLDKDSGEFSDDSWDFEGDFIATPNTDQFVKKYTKGADTIYTARIKASETTPITSNGYSPAQFYKET